MRFETISVLSVATVVTVLICALAASSAVSDYAIVQQVRAGANPLDARCAIGPSQSKEMCAIRAALTAMEAKND